MRAAGITLTVDRAHTSYCFTSFKMMLFSL